MSKEDSDGDTGSQASLRSDRSMDRPIDIQCPDRHKEDSDGDTGSQVSLRSDRSMDRPINFQCPDRHNHPDVKTVLPMTRDDYQRKLQEAISKQRKTEKEFKDFKERVSHQLLRSLETQDTENINKPVNKSRLKEMYDHLRINEWPKVTDQLRAGGEDPDSVCKIIQNTFEEAIDDVETLKKSMDKLFRNDLPFKVQEHLKASVESLQMAMFHNREVKASTAELAPLACQRVVSECYWLGCLMALNDSPLQLDWKNTHKQMDVWDFLPRHIISRYGLIDDAFRDSSGHMTDSEDNCEY
uniref:NACHT-associated domain-containing protein n=1 Tax=Knipowitschia caucasica TaxID=637954 RepID=A0AAV2LAZ4_KNICA